MLKILHIGKPGNVARFAGGLRLPEHTLAECRSGSPTADYLAAGGDADVLLADAMTPITAELIDAMPNLKLIHSEGVGYNCIDVGAASRRHIWVCNCRGCNAVAVAEQTLLLMLGVLRDVCGCDRAVREGRQIVVKEDYMVTGTLSELADHRVGLIGFGKIAKATARLLAPFGADVYYTKPCRADSATEQALGVTYLPLDELLATCSIVSLHLPVTDETRGMANDAFFAKMRDGSYFINTARGELADSGAILRALSSGKLRMAGLDTIAGEPIRKDNPILQGDADVSARLLLSPHIGGVTNASLHRAHRIFWRAVEALSAGDAPENIVNSWD